jgi:hypothetical protein
LLQLPLIHASDTPLLHASLQALLWLGANGFLFLLPLAVLPSTGASVCDWCWYLRSAW